MLWRLFLFELILVAVVAGVWLLAPLVGITSVLWRVLIILALVLPPIALVLWKVWRNRQAASGLESAMREQGQAAEDSARPDRRAEIEDLNENFGQAIAALKRSKLGGGRGTALYALPWYMIIGPPAVGKSTALVRSGLKFPFSTGDRKAIKGVGGTRNCDWWFSDQAILLDTAGRYTSEDDDLEEWTAFLRMLKKYRRKRPLNGLLVAVSIADIASAKSDEIEEEAAQVRSRIDQVIGELDLALPIYLLFTKCDLLSGFVEYFADLKKSNRGQVLGFTVPLTDASTNIEELFVTELDLLIDRLRERSLNRLAVAKSQNRARVFQFPLQFAAARDPLAMFVERLLTTNPYQECPRLRGVYFCSGTQEGRPVDRVMSMMTRALGLKELGGAGGISERATKKSYFLRDVFTSVIFPDRALAGTTASGRKRKRRLGSVGVAAAAITSLTAVSLSVATFNNNRTMIGSTVELAKSSRITTPEDPRKVTDSLRALDSLGQRVDTLRRYRADGPPWSLGLGFYQGDEMFPTSEQVYIKRMRQAFVLPAGSELEATLIDIGEATDYAKKGAERDFDLLKTYLMVTEPKRLDVEFATNVLIDQWGKRLHPDVSQERELLERNVKRYLTLVKAKRATWLERDNNLVRNVRHALRARDAEYRRIIGEAAAKLRPFTLRDALRGRVQTVIKGEHAVPGVYTRTGWSQYVRKRIAKKMASGASLEPWVLGEEEKQNLASRLRNRYFEHYIAAWTKFLRGLSVSPGTTAEESLALLERLTEAPPLYRDLFEAVAYNTELPLIDPGSGKGLRNASRLLPSRLRRHASRARRLGLDKAAGKALAGKGDGPVELAFLPLRELVKPPKGIDGRAQVSGLDQYQEQLDAVRDALSKDLKGSGDGEPGEMNKVIEEARRVTKGILATLPGTLRRLVSPVFYTPLETTAGTARTAQASRSAQSFSNELCASYKERLAGRYPFAKSDRDALMQDVVEFFGPAGTVWSYYEGRLKHQLPRRGNKFEATGDGKVPPQIISFINQGWKITRALFPIGSDQVRLRFEVRPRPAILSGGDFQISEIVLEVDEKARTYRNGPVEQWAFEWRGGGKRSRLMVRGSGGLHEEISYQGDWALLRLVDRGKVSKRGSWYQVQWPLKGGQIRIPMDIRPARSQNPLFGRMRLSCK